MRTDEKVQVRPHGGHCTGIEAVYTFGSARHAAASAVCGSVDNASSSEGMHPGHLPNDRKPIRSAVIPRCTALPDSPAEQINEGVRRAWQHKGVSSNRSFSGLGEEHAEVRLKKAIIGERLARSIEGQTEDLLRREASLLLFEAGRKTPVKPSFWAQKRARKSFVRTRTSCTKRACPTDKLRIRPTLPSSVVSQSSRMISEGPQTKDAVSSRATGFGRLS